MNTGAWMAVKKVPDFESGVSWYTEAQATIYFPEGKVCCDLCPMLETYARKQCRKTGEYLADTRTIGYMCPLKFIEKQEETNNESI